MLLTQMIPANFLRSGIKRMQMKREEIRLLSSHQDLPKNRLQEPSKYSLQLQLQPRLRVMLEGELGLRLELELGLWLELELKLTLDPELFRMHC